MQEHEIDYVTERDCSIYRYITGIAKWCEEINLIEDVEAHLF